jgi:hypothetical protein
MLRSIQERTFKEKEKKSIKYLRKKRYKTLDEVDILTAPKFISEHSCRLG